MQPRPKHSTIVGRVGILNANQINEIPPELEHVKTSMWCKGLRKCSRRREMERLQVIIIVVLPSCGKWRPGILARRTANSLIRLATLTLGNSQYSPVNGWRLSDRIFGNYCYQGTTLVISRKSSTRSMNAHGFHPRYHQGSWTICHIDPLWILLSMSVGFWFPSI